MHNLKFDSLKEIYLNSLVDLDKTCFIIPWSKKLFENDITNPNAFYILAINNEKVIAYCGLYKVLDEADITNIAVHPDFRKKGLASMLLDMIFKYWFERTDNMIITRTSARSLIEFNNGSNIKMISSACNVRGQYANLVLCDDWLLFNENLMYIERHK